MENQPGDSRVRIFSFQGTPEAPGRREGPEIKLITNGHWLNHLCLHRNIHMKNVQMNLHKNPNGRSLECFQAAEHTQVLKGQASREDVEPPGTRKTCLAQCVYSIWLLMSCILQNKPVMVKVLSWVPWAALANYHTWGGDHEDPHLQPTGFPGDSDDKESTCNAGVLGLIPRSRRCSGEENGYPLQYSGLENPMDRGAWRAIQSTRSKRVRHDWATNTFTFITWDLWLAFKVEDSLEGQSPALWSPLIPAS